VGYCGFQGDDVVFLPAIVEAAVASPAAAAECARLIRKYMNRDYWTKPSFQYNAIMLARILADNPGPGFTKFIDKKFADTAKELLRSGRDASVRQILMETLDAFETTKSNDENLVLITQMWKKEKEKAYKAYGVSAHIPDWRSAMLTHHAESARSRRFPDAHRTPLQPLPSPAPEFPVPAAPQQAPPRPRRAREPP
jgi:hypothetical protein